MWRYAQRLDETSQWAYWTKRDAGGPAFFGHLTGLRLPTRGHPMELLPYAVLSTQSPAPGRWATHTGAGGDLRYLLSPGASVIATINPDFAQVEADPAVLNLGTVETLYPEKRPFFVDASGLFAFTDLTCFTCAAGSLTGLFYSRRIGRSPRYVPVGTSVTSPDASTIAAAAKLVVQSRGGLSAGVLNALTLRANAVVEDAAGVARVPVEPVTNFLVARVKGSAADGRGVLGSMLTFVTRDLPTPALAGLLPRNEVAIAGDTEWWWGRRTYHVQGSVSLSYVSGDTSAIRRIQQSSVHYLDRPDRTGTSGGASPDGFDPLARHLAGYALNGRVAREAGDWSWEALGVAHSPGFEVNEAGYEPRADAVFLAASLRRNLTRPARYYRSMSFTAGVQQSTNFSGDVLDRQLTGRVNVVFPSAWTLTATHVEMPPVVSDRLTRGGPLVGIPAGRHESLAVATAERGTVAGALDLEWQRRRDGGYTYDVIGRLTLRPAAGVAASLEPSVGAARDPSQYVATVSDETAGEFFGRRYVFATLRQRTVELGLRLEAAVTPELSLSLYAQPFLASGAYSDLGEFARPGTTARLVYGVDRGTIRHDAAEPGTYTVDPDGSGPALSFPIADPDFTLHSWRSNAVLRWEYRPGATLFVVWTQSRELETAAGTLDLRRDTPDIFATWPRNVFLIKASYWLDF